MKKLVIPMISMTMMGVALAGCGSDGSDAASGEKGPIKLVQIIPVESQITSLPFMKTSAEAAVAEINAGGGVGGRKLELTTCNDKYDPNESVRCAQSAVRDGAIALVGNLTGFGGQIMPLLEKANMPSIGAIALSDVDATSTMSYLYDPGAAGGFAAIPAVAKKQFGATKVALMQPEGPSVESNITFFQAGADAAGVKIVEKIAVPLDAIDYTQYIARAEASGATVLISPRPDVKIFKALETAGSDLKVVGSNGDLTPQAVKEVSGAAEGSYLVGGTPQADETNEYGKQYVAAMKKYRPEEKVYASVGLRAYFAVHLFADVADKIDGDIDRDSLVDALDGTKDLKFAWVPSLNFTEPGPIDGLPRVVSPLSFPTRITNGSFEAAEAFDPFA